MIVSKLDFSIVEFSQNIEDKKIFPYIIEQDEEKIKPVLGGILHTAVRLISDTNPLAWDPATAYTIGKYATNVGDTPTPLDKAYRAIQAGTNHALTDPVFWIEDPLATFWLNYVKPFSVYTIYQEFFLWHGNNVWQSGMGTNYSDSSGPMAPQTRSELISNVKNKAQVRKDRMLNYLKSVNWIIDTVNYTIPCGEYHKDKGLSIRAVGKKRY